MTENLAGRGEGLAGLREALKIATRELWHTQMPIAVNAAMPSVIPCVRDCVKCMCERALEAAAPAPTWDDAYAAGLKLRDTMREGVAALATPPQAQPLSECKNPDCPVGCPDSHALSFDPDRLPNVTVTTGGPPNASPPSWHEEPQVTTVNSDLALAHSAFKETYLQGNLPAATQEQPAGSGANERIWCMECGKSVSTPVPKDTIVRAWVQCPECIEKGKGLCNSQTQK